MQTNDAHTDDITIGEEAMAQFVRPGLKVGHIIPGFKLNSAQNAEISPVDYKGRKNLVIIFADLRSGSDLEMLAEVGRRYHEFADDNAEVLAIATGSKEEFDVCAKTLRLQFPLLSDAGRETTCSYCVAGTMIFVTDKFGELKMLSGLTESNLDEKLDAARSTLELIELECPECGVSTWPVE